MKKLAIKPTTVQYIEKTTCDFCGEQIPPHNHNDDTITIKHEHNIVADPDGGGKTDNLDVDCCRKCWDMKLLPMMKVLGMKVEYTRTEC